MGKNFNWTDEADYLVVGTGASGAVVGHRLASRGESVIFLEEGRWYRTHDHREELFEAVAHHFRDFGMQVAKGRSVIPILQGRCVGGTTLMNGAIVHRFPKEVYDTWALDTSLGKNIPWAEFEEEFKEIEQELRIARTPQPLAPELPVAGAITSLGWRAQRMVRNAPECRASARCLQGCPSGGKWSTEKSYIPWAMAQGARVFAEHQVEKLYFERGIAIGLVARHSRRSLQLRAKKGIVLAAGVLHSAEILRRSGYRHPALGKNFQCHLGIAATGIMDRPITELEGRTQGIEILKAGNFRGKLATQQVPAEVALVRTPLVGTQLRDRLRELDRVSTWTASVRSSATGYMRYGRLYFSPSQKDLEEVRQGLYLIVKLLFQLGAKEVFPGVMCPKEIPVHLTRPTEAEALLKIPLDARHFIISVGHLFGTLSMGSDSKASVVSPNFAPYQTQNLSVVDASIFPTNLGLNPQHSIMALASLASKRVNHLSVPKGAG